MSSKESSSFKFPSKWYIDNPILAKYFSIFDGSMTPHNPKISIIILNDFSDSPLIIFWSNISTKFIFSSFSKDNKLYIAFISSILLILSFLVFSLNNIELVILLFRFVEILGEKPGYISIFFILIIWYSIRSDISFFNEFIPYSLISKMQIINKNWKYSSNLSLCISLKLFNIISVFNNSKNILNTSVDIILWFSLFNNKSILISMIFSIKVKSRKNFKYVV